MFSSNSIRLFWWNEVKLQGKPKENYGDLLGKYLVEKISNKKVVWVKPATFSLYNLFTPIYVTIGSILTHVNKKCVVWGSGIISKQYQIKKAKFLAVRGPQTRKLLLKQGHQVPEVYGDPAILLPRYYNPDIKKEYKLGVIPHYNDFKEVSGWFKDRKDVLLIDLMTDDIEATTNQFLKCERIISSSLHGLIVAHAYQIPAVWQRFSDKLFGDDIKFQDYFESVNLSAYSTDIISENPDNESLLKLFENRKGIPEKIQIDELCDGLMEVCPFKQ